MSNDRKGIYFILIGMFFLSIQDVLVRQLAEYASLFQIMFIRGIVGSLSLIIFLKLTSVVSTSVHLFHYLQLVEFCFFLQVSYASILRYQKWSLQRQQAYSLSHHYL